MEQTSNDNRQRTFTEEFEIAGSQLVDRVKTLFADSKVRRVRIKSADGALILDLPLTVGAIASGAVALAAPWLAVIGTFAALVANAKLEVSREEVDEASNQTPTATRT
jgi:hypothetical protein